MPTERKVQAVASLRDQLSRMQLAVVADYRGLTVAEITDLRRKLRESGAEMVIAKNTLIRIAANETGREGLLPMLAGPTAIAFAYDDVAKTAKTFEDYLKTSKKLAVRGALLGTTPLGADALEMVSKMPSREQVLGQVVGGLQSPLTGLVGMINAPVSGVYNGINGVVGGFLNVLQGRIEQMQTAA